MKSFGKWLQIAGFLMCTAVPVWAFLFLTHPANGGTAMGSVLFGLLAFGVGRFASSLAT